MSRVVVAVGFLIGGLALVLVYALARPAPDREFNSARPRSAGEPSSMSSPTATVDKGEPAGSRSIPTPPVEEPGDSAGGQKVRASEFLADYWGARWPEIEKEILDKWEALGLDGRKEVLDLEIDLALMPTWEEVEADFEAKVVRPPDAVLDRLTHAWVELADSSLNYHLQQAGKRPSEEHREALRQAAEPYQAEMAEAVLTLAIEESRYRERVWKENLFARGPVAAAGGPEFLLKEGDGAGGSISIQGWGLSYRLEPSLDYGYMVALQRVQELSRLRTLAILDAVGSL